MDHKELANLIFPNAKDVSYYEEKYPERENVEIWHQCSLLTKDISWK